VHGVEEVNQLAQGVCGFAAYWGLKLKAALDVGAGTGLWRHALARQLPQLRYTGVDISPFACASYGHLKRDISRWKSRKTFDLVICQGVLQYLDDTQAEAALENLAAMASGLLYLEALTVHDWQQRVDRERTDGAVYQRTGAWYRKRLRSHFITVGAGLYAARHAGMVFFELEAQAR
jgi:SAM-dependent methyltransferase